jgi:GGDEF domain-containing protein
MPEDNGGEEFLIVLSNCNQDGLRTRAEHISTAIASVPIRIGNAELSISISIGAAFAVPPIAA